MSLTPNIRIRLNTKEVMDAFKPLPKEVKRVNRLVVNKIVDTVHRKGGGELPRRAGSSVGGFRRVRAKKRRVLARHKTVTGRVWFGGNRISARFGGTPRNVKGGAKAGRHFFKGAFVARFKSGFTSIFKRKANSSKLIEQTIDVPELAAISNKLVNSSKKSADALVNVEMTKVLNKRASRFRNG